MAGSAVWAELLHDLRAQYALDLELRTLTAQCDPTSPKTAEVFGALLHSDASSTSWYPSANRNRVEHVGVSNEIAQGDVAAWIAHYADLGVPRFFVYLPPVEQENEVFGWMDAMGFRQCINLVWLHKRLGNESLAKGFRIAPARRDHLHEVLTERGSQPLSFQGTTLAILDRDPRYQTFLAYDDGVPSATGSLYMHGDYAYLGNAHTIPAHRERGLQKALIRHRLHVAAQLGCTRAASATYRFLGASFSNLQKCGFDEHYETRILRYEFDPQIRTSLHHSVWGHEDPGG